MRQAILAGCWRFRGKADQVAKVDPADTDQEQVWLQAGRAGDQVALELLLGQYEAELLRLCRALLLHPGEAEDAVQEVFLRFLQSLSVFRAEASVKTWLFRIAINLCRDWSKRSESRQRDRFVSFDAIAEESARAVRATLPSVEAIVVSRLTIDAALATLSPRQRTLLILREQEQWSSKDIGEMLGWSERKVQYELVKVRQALALWQQGEGNE